MIEKDFLSMILTVRRKRDFKGIKSDFRGINFLYYNVKFISLKGKFF